MLTLYSPLLSPQLAANYSLQQILRKLPTPYFFPPIPVTIIFYNFQDTAGLFCASEMNFSMYSTTDIAETEHRYRQEAVILTSSMRTH